MNKDILKLAIPSILANITIPLVGLVDVAIIGHISDATAIGGIAIGTLLFDLLYWNFGFLRVGTSGLTAQAFGAKDDRLAVGIFRQNLLLAGFSTLLVWAIQWLFLMVALKCIPCTPEVADFASRYFYIRIWAAPATLGLMPGRMIGPLELTALGPAKSDFSSSGLKKCIAFDSKVK